MLRRSLLLLLGSLWFPIASFAATATWTGATSGQWSVGTNWSGNTPPSPGDDLVFPTNVHSSMVNDFPAGTFFRSLTFTANAHYTISGNALSIGAGGITATPNVISVFPQPSITLTQPQTWSGNVHGVSLILAAGPATLRCGGEGRIGGSISGSGGISCSDPGSDMRLGLTGMTYTGPTVIGGSHWLEISSDGGDILTPITVNAGGTFFYRGGGRSIKALTLHRGSTYRAWFEVTLVATEPVTLEGHLNLINISDPVAEYTLIENRSGQPITGTFEDYPEGALIINSVESKKYLYRISYVGGASGHDVTLTLANATTLTLSASPTTATHGAPVTLTATISPPASGTVTFRQDGVLGGGTGLGTVMLDATGQAVLTTTALGFGFFGPRDVWASYSGSDTHSASRSETIQVTVTPPGTAFLLSAGRLGPDGAGLHAELTTDPLGGAPPPQGTVNFYEGASLLGSCPTLYVFAVQHIAFSGWCDFSVAGLAAGKHVFSAVWIPDDGQPPKQSGTAELLIPEATTTTLTISPTTANEGEPVTITAHVAPGATGSVFFTGGIGARVPLNANGDAILTTSTLPPRRYDVVATYSGDPLHEGSMSAAAPVTILANQIGEEIPTVGELGLAALGALLAMLALFKLRG